MKCARDPSPTTPFSKQKVDLSAALPALFGRGGWSDARPYAAAVHFYLLSMSAFIFKKKWQSSRPALREVEVEYARSIFYHVVEQK